MSSVPDRNEVAEEYKWDLEAMFADDDEWEAAYEAVQERLAELDAYEGRVTESAETLQAVLERREELMREVSNVTTLLKEPDRAFRREVHDSFYEEWEDYRNTVATAYEKAVKKDVKLARARNYETAREASLDGANVPLEVYDTLVDTVGDNLDVLHRHAELKADRLGVDTLEMWDLYASLTEEEAPDIDYERAKEWVVDAVAPLGDAYRDRMAEGLESRWVDVYENEGKRSGAYSGGTYDSQPYVYSDYDIFTAEVASTVNEALLTEHLLETLADETLRRHVLDEYLERFRSTLFRQTMFADFEHQAHRVVEEGGALTPDELDELYGDLKRAYYEPAHVDEHITREWMRIPHFYYGFYVYQYSTGISAANALARDIREEGEPAAERYREFLRSGSRQYPLDLLRDAGVDMTTADPVEAAIDAYDRYVAEFEQLS